MKSMNNEVKQIKAEGKKEPPRDCRSTQRQMREGNEKLMRPMTDNSDTVHFFRRIMSFQSSSH